MINKEFFETVPLGLCVVQRGGATFKILYANHAFLYLLRNPAFVTPFDVLGQPLAGIWPNRAMSGLIQKLKTPSPPRDFTLPVDDAEGEIQRWAKIAISEGEYDGHDAYVLWATDISASKVAETRLEQAVKAADALAQAKSNFLATMSHEIRTPMQTIYGFLELIGEEKPEQAVQTMVDTAKKSASGLLEILDDILDFAKMDADQMELDHFEVPVRTLVRGTLEALSVKVHGKDVQILDDIAQDVPFVVIGDPKRLRQIIMNLTGNALKFTGQGSVTVSVSRKTKAMAAPKTGIALRFEIRDTGIGMNEDARQRMFKPFSQADSSTSRKYGGTGLGLSICKRLVELMGGQIGVESSPGVGSVFWFEIPTEEVSIQSSTADLPSLEGISVLSVEDHPQGAREIVKSLQSMGAIVESCPTYKEALDLVRRRPFDVGVIDQGLPDGLGLDLIKDVMNMRPGMGLIMYTVRDDLGLQHSLQSLGVTYLSKPASRLGLGTVVKDATRKQTRVSADGIVHLLIAEDNDTVREVLRRQLEKLNVTADFVTNGKLALEAMERVDYSIVFTDLHMPEIDGYDLVKILREREAKEGHNAGHLPIVVLTADVQMAQRQVYLAEGFDECLLKPVSLGQMRRLLMRWGLLPDIVVAEPEEPASVPAQGSAIDIGLLMEQMGMDREGAVEILGMFVEMTEPLIDQIQKDNHARHFESLTEAAHSLKGAARSACCLKLGDLAARLQDESADRKPADRLVAAIVDSFNDVKTSLHSL
ncbi:MAG: sensory box histidine kinase/response regulator [Micavibrio sp.]|nr:sensory box histidine kinase/response regulator [Micavibrio sp.]